MNYETQAVYNEPNPNKDGVIISPTTTESNVKNFPEGSIYIYHGNPPPFQYISNEHHTLEDLEEMARKRLKRDREKFRRSELSDGLKEVSNIKILVNNITNAFLFATNSIIIIIRN
jgi:hypothetical protein